MIRRTVKVQLAVFVLITVLGILYLGFDLIGLNAIRPPFTVKARLAASGGIFTNAEVTYRGVGVGRVGSLRLIEDGVEVDLRIDRGTKVPSDLLAVVANKSAVGEQYVDLQPRRDGAPYLRHGDVIARSDTRIPVDIQTVVVDFDRFVRSIDRESLTVLVDELGDAFDGAGPALQELIDSGDLLIETFQEKLPETVRLIREGKVVLDTARATSSDFERFATGLAALSESLRDADPDVRRLLDNGVVAARELDALLRPSQRALSVLLGNLVSVNDLQIRRLGGLDAVLDSLPNVARYGTDAIVDGQLHNGLVVDEEAPACTYDTDRRLPNDHSPRDPDVDNHCPPGMSGQRGEEYAPRPGDESPTGVPFAGAAPVQGWTGGQSEALGRQSWLSLLLALVR